MYHSIPADIRPPPGVALLHYLDAFNLEMAFQVGERDTATLEEMQNIAVDVEVNLLSREAKFKTEEELTQFDSPPHYALIPQIKCKHVLSCLKAWRTHVMYQVLRLDQLGQNIQKQVKCILIQWLYIWRSCSSQS